ncbi:hypothetical protein ACTXM8_13310 [Brachybacterium alimentarium]
MAPEDGPSALFYRGKVNGLAGESNAGKSWTGLMVASQEIAKGHSVVFLDLEADPVSITERLLGMGADPGAVTAQFVYLSPRERLSPDSMAGLMGLIDELQPTLVVVDSTGESVSLEGMRPNDDDEIARWFRLLPRPLAEHPAEPAVVLLDHMAKVDGGMWPIGSQRKRASIQGAQYIQSVSRESAFSKDKSGYAVIKVAKDRHGTRAQHDTAAYLMVSPGPDGTSIDLTSGASVTQSAPGASGVDQAERLLERLGLADYAGQGHAWEFVKQKTTEEDRPNKRDVQEAQSRRKERAAEQAGEPR